MAISSAFLLAAYHNLQLSGTSLPPRFLQNVTDLKGDIISAVLFQTRFGSRNLKSAECPQTGEIPAPPALVLLGEIVLINEDESGHWQLAHDGAAPILDLYFPAVCQ